MAKNIGNTDVYITFADPRAHLRRLGIMAQSKGRRRFPAKERKLGDEQGLATQEAASLAAYIADMADELSLLAQRCDMPMLSYFLNLARVEAETRARELGGYAADRSA